MWRSIVSDGCIHRMNRCHARCRNLYDNLCVWLIWFRSAVMGASASLTPMTSVTNRALPLQRLHPELSCSEMERFHEVSSSHEASGFHEASAASTQRETLLYKIRVGWEQQRTREEGRGNADAVLQYPCDSSTLDSLYELATLDAGDLAQEHRCRLGMQPSCAEMQCLAYLPLCCHVRLRLDLQAERQRLEEARVAYLAELDQAAALKTFFCAGCGKVPRWLTALVEVLTASSFAAVALQSGVAISMRQLHAR